MTLREAKRLFIDSCYENESEYRKERKKNYCMAQLRWSFFMDNLQRDGLITMEQYQKATF